MTLTGLVRRAGDRGSVTAEFAVVLPAVVLVLALGAATLGVCGQQVRLQDAAADAARLVARGEPAGRAQAVLAAAVGGAHGAIAAEGELVCVTATARAALPVPVPPLRARSCALAGGL
ncbi:TadE family type IV pilus minor pilin [Microbacterium terrisoli]|uniref:TadE family type IV pilus minor pilin n=1 Tax=Microbacterium terrisoli TaxID=3242192 RepID=UPI0028054CCF|nr:TadE family type IV pilus minor pilin [Microbacterium protaetiae]